METKLNWDACSSSKKEGEAFFDEETYKLYSTSKSYDELVQSYGQPSLPSTSAPKEKAKPVILNAYQQKQALMSPKPQFPFPRFSYLSKDEHKNYLGLSAKFKHLKPEMYQTYLDQRELQYFMNLKSKVIQEQEEYNRYLEFIAKNSPKDYQFLHTDIKKYIEELLIVYEEQTSMYPLNYKLYQTLGITTGMPFSTDSTMKHIKTLLTMGSVPFMMVPYYDKSKSSVTRDYSNMISECPPIEIAHQEPSVQCTHKPVSKDDNAKKLAAKYQVDIVISTSGLETLIDNHAPYYENQWEIPVTVREHSLKQENGELVTVKTVYIDKPLLRRDYFTNRQKSQLFHTVSFPQLFKGHRNQSPKTLQSLHDIFQKDKYSTQFKSSFGRHETHTDNTIIAQICEDADKKRNECVNNSSVSMATIKEKKYNIPTPKMDGAVPSTSTQVLPSGSLNNQVRSAVEPNTQYLTSHISTRKEAKFHLHESGENQDRFSHQVKVADASPETLIAPAGNLLSDSSSQGNASDLELVIDLDSNKSCDSQDDSKQTTELDKRRPEKNSELVEGQGSNVKGKYELKSDCSELEVRSPPVRRSARLQAITSPDNKDKQSNMTEKDVAPSRKRSRSNIRETRGARKEQESSIGCSEAIKVITQCAGIRRSKRLKSETEKSSEDSKESSDSDVDQSSMGCGVVTRKGNKGKRKKTAVKRKDGYDNEKDILNKNESAQKQLSIKESQTGTMHTGEGVEDIEIKESDNKMIAQSSAGPDTNTDTRVSHETISSTSNTKQSRTGNRTVDSIFKLKEKLEERKHHAANKEKSTLAVPNTEMLSRKEWEKHQEWLQRLLRVNEDSQEYIHPSSGNVAYDLWSFGKLRILIRSRAYGYINHGGKVKLVKISPKLEYQPLFGLEHTSIGQVSREWINSYIQPETILVRGHINAYTSEVMLLESLDISTLLSSSNFNPAGSMKMLYTVFEKLKVLPVGQFLLSHSRGDLHVCIYQTVNPDQTNRYVKKRS